MEIGEEDQVRKATTHPEWLKIIFDRYHRPLVSYAAQLLNGYIEAARDCVQDTFLSLCKQPREEVEDHVEAWLFKSCRNRAIDHFRREVSMIVRAEHSVLMKQDRIEVDPSKQFELREEKDRMESQIKLLSEKEQEVLSLRLSHGLSYKQIAEVTGLSTSHVGVTLHQAVMRLRSALAERS